MDFIYSVFSFVVAIGVLVTVHEFGHFWVARRLGVKVLRFSVGFGRPLWLWRAGPDRTEYVIAAIPLGGYVKMLDEREGEVADAERARAFNRQPWGVRVAVVLAGPLFNFLFAVVAYALRFMIGVSGLRPMVGEVFSGSIAEGGGLRAQDEVVSVNENRTRTWEAVIQGVLADALKKDSVALEVRGPEGQPRSLSLGLGRVAVDDLTQGQFFDTLGIRPARPRIAPIIGKVEVGSPAEHAGLQAGDEVVAADGQPITAWSAWVEYVRARPRQVIETEVLRNGDRILLALRPAAVEDASGVIGRIGAAVEILDEPNGEFYVTERYPPLEALGRGVVKTYEVSLLTLQMLWKMVRLEVSVSNLSGPISIAQYAGSSAQIGLSRFLQFLAIVSVSLGILNLLPIPILDGGHLMYYCIELFKGRPVSEEAQLVGQRLGIAVLVGLMGLAFYNDLARLFG